MVPLHLEMILALQGWVLFLNARRGKVLRKFATLELPPILPFEAPEGLTHTGLFPESRIYGGKMS
jgi:hypothetical protein